MANPRSRHSRTRQAKRRTHYKAEAPTLAVCSHCGAMHITLYVLTVVIIVVSWQSKRKRLSEKEDHKKRFRPQNTNRLGRFFFIVCMLLVLSLSGRGSGQRSVSMPVSELSAKYL